MLIIPGHSHHLCDGFSRRDFLRVGVLGGLGLSLPDFLQAGTSQGNRSGSFGRAKQCVLLFLTGGPSQLDTFDLKPEAPAEIRGELKPIATHVPGIQVGELCRHMAREADKYCILRSVTHADTVHTSAGYTMLTGALHPQANSPGGAKSILPSPDDHPHLGSLVSKVRPAVNGMPTFASLPEVIKDAGTNEFPGQTAGFLGHQHDPFRIELDAATGTFRTPDLTLPSEMTVDRLDDRRLLLQEVNQTLQAFEHGSGFSELGGYYERAFALIRSTGVQQAFQLDREPDSTRKAYGGHLFGRGCLLARRLLEVGLPLVTVYWHYEGPDDSPVWDTHQNNFAHLRNRLVPPADQALASLLSDLSARGMLADTLVLCMGEFGRSPRINKHAGRDHWPHAQSVIMAGAGIQGGSTYGATDRIGAYPTDMPVTPADLAATVLHLLGVSPELELRDRLNRPMRACQGTPIAAFCS